MSKSSSSPRLCALCESSKRPWGCCSTTQDVYYPQGVWAGLNFAAKYQHLQDTVPLCLLHLSVWSEAEGHFSSSDRFTRLHVLTWLSREMPRLSIVTLPLPSKWGAHEKCNCEQVSEGTSPNVSLIREAGECEACSGRRAIMSVTFNWVSL